jgi:D-3-phosphoglycerate dehydrogenase
MTNWKPVTPRVLDSAGRCRTVARYGVGVDNIAVEHASTLGMVVTNVPDYCVEEVSSHAIALLMACGRRIVTFARATREGVWDLQAAGPLPRFSQQTLGLVGFGRIARAVAQKAAGLGLRVHAFDPHLADEAISPAATPEPSLSALLAASDYVSLHVPATPATEALIGAAELREMRSTAYLINTARGAIVDQRALEDALAGGVIAGAALDVLETEPPVPTTRLLRMDNVIVTPHAAFSSVASVEELRLKTAQNVKAVLTGEMPEAVVNRAVLESAAFRNRH